MKARFSRARALPPARVGCRTSRCSGASCNPRVLLLGCGVGNLATILARAGKQIDVVDCNPTSFDIAREYFSMPKEIACVSAAFGQFLAEANEKFDGIDVGGPGFCYEEKFDAATCSAVVGGIHPGGRAVLNMLAGSDYDAAPDKIGVNLSVGRSSGWILDRPGEPNRKRLHRFSSDGSRTGEQAAHHRASSPRSTLALRCPRCWPLLALTLAVLPVAKATFIAAIWVTKAPGID